MHFLRSVLLAAACSTLTLSVSAAPAPTFADLSTREIEEAALERRIFGSLGKMIVGAQQGQSRRQDKSERKRKANKKITSSVARQRAPDHETAGLSSSERARLHQSYTDKERDRAVSRAQQAAKAERASRWAPSGGSHRSGRTSGGATVRYASPSDRGRVASSLHDAGGRMQHTDGIPHRADTFRVDGFSTTGQHVRQAVSHSYVHHADPVGRGDNKAPKEFRNDPYSHSHGDSSLRGSRPIPHADGRTLYEYPVRPARQSSSYVGTGPPGPARVVTSHYDGRDRFHGVIGHDAGRGGDKDDHYMASYQPHSGSSYSSSRYH